MATENKTKGTGNFKFRAEIQQLLDILVHSLYTNKEIFLRELVSNASDALDKLRFEQQRGAEISDPDTPLEIRITTDKEANTLTVADSGVGMTRDELVANLGTIAHSGTADFVKEVQEAEAAGNMDSIIGRFGVGFYSVFMVADEVTITTRSYHQGEPGWVWKSKGAGSFTISPAEGEVPRGASMEIKLKDDADKFADPDTIRDVIKRHSNFISFPIFVDNERVNTIEALWREPKFNIKPEQYEEFYKFLTLDSQGPLETIHVSADAPIQFSALMFIPSRDLDPMNMMREQPGLDLYVRRVLIQRENKDLLPEYLGFIRGVVDSEDLPLNISRETLQENLLLRKISSSLTKQVLGHLTKLAIDDSDKYQEFWGLHGKVFKLGYSDFANRDKVAELVRFNSSTCDDAEGLVSFQSYVDRAREDQKEIYYAAGNSRAAVESSPHLEIFKRKGIEVLYLYEPIDDFIMDALREFKEHKLVSIEHADLAKLEQYADKEESEAVESLSEEDDKSFGDLLARMKDILGEKVAEVRRSMRLKDSPVCLVGRDAQMTSSMEKIMRIMTKDETPPVKILEVNPDSPLVRNLLAIYKKNPQDDYLSLATQQLFEAALLQDGYLSDPHGLVNRLQDLLTRSSGWYKER